MTRILQNADMAAFAKRNRQIGRLYIVSWVTHTEIPARLPVRGFRIVLQLSFSYLATSSAKTATSIIATILAILINGLTAGPAVSL